MESNKQRPEGEKRLMNPSSQMNAPSHHPSQRKHGVPGDIHRQPREIKPQFVQMIERLLERQGIEYYEKNVTNQLLEFMHYYVTEILQEAKIYKEYAGKKQIDVNDVKLAISSKAYNSFTRPLPLSVIKQIVYDKNNQALPRIEDVPAQTAVTSGMQHHQVIQRAGDKLSQILPSNEYCQINPNLHVYSEEIAKRQEERYSRRQQQEEQERSLMNLKLQQQQQQIQAQRQAQYAQHKEAKNMIQFDNSIAYGSTGGGKSNQTMNTSMSQDDSQYEIIQKKQQTQESMYQQMQQQNQIPLYIPQQPPQLQPQQKLQNNIENMNFDEDEDGDSDDDEGEDDEDAEMFKNQ